MKVKSIAKFQIKCSKCSQVYTHSEEIEQKGCLNILLGTKIISVLEDTVLEDTSVKIKGKQPQCPYCE